jgi:HEAT repeat protein
VIQLLRLSIGDRKTSSPAIEELERLGAAAIPGLVAALGDADARYLARDRLARLGAVAAPALVDVLQHGGPGRQLAPPLVGSIGSDAAMAVPALLRCLHDPDAKTREASALGSIRASASEVIPSLIHVLGRDEETSDVLDAAIRALEKYGPEARPAIPDLVRLAAMGHMAAGMALDAIGASRRSWFLP